MQAMAGSYSYDTNPTLKDPDKTKTDSRGKAWAFPGKAEGLVELQGRGHKSAHRAR